MSKLSSGLYEPLNCLTTLPVISYITTSEISIFILKAPVVGLGYSLNC